jgi:phage gp36-like protein
MKYITQDGLDSILSDASLKALTAKNGQVDTELLEKTNLDAVGEIDGHLRGIYELPLADPVDQLLSTICGDLMKFRLYKRRDEKAMPENVITMYKLAVSKLEKIHKREITLDVPSTTTGSGSDTSESGTIQYHTPTQKFRTHFTGFDQ